MPRSGKPEKKMDLILWRHAEAEEATGGLPDERRGLTDGGKKQANDMAQWLKKRLPKKLRILVSPTERTQMTARALELPFEVVPSISPDATAADLLAAAGWPDDGGSVVIVGHQPTLGRVAALLLAGKEVDCAIKKSGIWWFSQRTHARETQTTLRAAISAEML